MTNEHLGGVRSHYATHKVAMAPLSNAITLMGWAHTFFLKISPVSLAANVIDFKGQMIFRKGETIAWTDK